MAGNFRRAHSGRAEVRYLTSVDSRGILRLLNDEGIFGTTNLEITSAYSINWILFTREFEFL